MKSKKPYKVYVYDYAGDTYKPWRVEWYLPNPNFRPGSKERKKIRYKSQVPIGFNKKRRYEWIRAFKKRKAEEFERLKESYSAKRAPFPDGLIAAITVVYNRKKERSQWKPKTCASYGCILKSFINWVKKSPARRILKVSDFTCDLAEQFLLEVVRGKGYSDKTFNDYRNFLSSIFNEVIRHAPEIISKNPFTQVKTVHVFPRTKQLLTEDQYKYYSKWLHEVDYGMYTMALLLRATLARPLELLRCRVEDIDLERQLVFISQDIGKTKMDRTPVIPNNIVDELRHLKNYPADFFLFGSDMKPGKKPKSTTRLFELHKEYVRQMGLPEWWTLYKNKHYGNFLYAKAGLPMNFIQTQNGHTSPRTTEVYMNTVPMANMSYEAIRNTQI